MADKLARHRDDASIMMRFRDLGDGTYALVTSASPGYGGAPVHVNSGVVANQQAQAVLPGVPGMTTYLTGFEITGTGSTLATAVRATVDGLLGGTASYVYGAVAGALLGNAPLIVQFTPPIPAAAPNTAITVTLPALGLGNANACVVAHGFQL